MKLDEEMKQKGYRRYRGAVADTVYDYFLCDRSDKAVWYVKEGSYCCMGCRERCETDSPDGFQLSLIDMD